MPRRKKTTTTSDHNNGIGAAFAPMIRAIVREEIGRLMLSISREYGIATPPETPPTGTETAPETGHEAPAPRPGKRNKGNGAAPEEAGA
jgi:hypothetical protein